MYTIKKCITEMLTIKLPVVFSIHVTTPLSPVSVSVTVTCPTVAGGRTFSDTDSDKPLWSNSGELSLKSSTVTLTKVYPCKGAGLIPRSDADTFRVYCCRDSRSRIPETMISPGNR